MRFLGQIAAMGLTTLASAFAAGATTAAPSPESIERSTVRTMEVSAPPRRSRSWQTRASSPGTTFPDGKTSTEEIVRALRYLEPSSSFRSRCAYDNLLYVVAGELAQRVAGVPLAEAFSPARSP